MPATGWIGEVAGDPVSRRQALAAGAAGNISEPTAMPTQAAVPWPAAVPTPSQAEVSLASTLDEQELTASMGEIGQAGAAASAATGSTSPAATAASAALVGAAEGAGVSNSTSANTHHCVCAQNMRTSSHLNLSCVVRSDHARRAGQLEAASASAAASAAAVTAATARPRREQKRKLPAEAPGSNGEPQYASKKR